MDHSGHVHVTGVHDHHDHHTPGYDVVTDATTHDHAMHDHAMHDHAMHDHSMHEPALHDHSMHGIGGHDGHASHADHHLSYFHNSLNATALFENWILDTNGSIFLACLFTFILAMGYQGTKWLRQYLHVNYGNTIHSIKSKEHLLQTVLYVTEFIVSYLLMLLVMTYNLWVFLLTVFGITLGYFLLAWHKEFKTGCSKDCPNVTDFKNKDYDRNPSSQELMPLENGSQPDACGGCGIEVVGKMEDDSD